MSISCRTLLMSIMALALVVQSVCAGLCAMSCAAGSCPIQLGASSSVAACCDHDAAEEHDSPLDSGSESEHHSAPITPCSVDNAIAWAPGSFSIKPLIPVQLGSSNPADAASTTTLVVHDFEIHLYALAIGTGPPDQFYPSSNSDRAPPVA